MADVEQQKRLCLEAAERQRIAFKLAVTALQEAHFARIAEIEAEGELSKAMGMQRDLTRSLRETIVLRRRARQIESVILRSLRVTTFDIWKM